MSKPAPIEEPAANPADAEPIPVVRTRQSRKGKQNRLSCTKNADAVLPSFPATADTPENKTAKAKSADETKVEKKKAAKVTKSSCKRKFTFCINRHETNLHIT